MEKREQIQQLGKDIGELSTRLKHLDAQKEEKYQEISETNTKLNDLLKQASELKAGKAELAKQIQDKKENRDKLNTNVKTLAIQLKSVPVVRIDMRSRESPRALREQLNHLELKLQTEVVNYKNEQKAMALIKELRTKLKHIEKSESDQRKYQDARGSLRISKMAADTLHREVQHAATHNSKLFTKLSAVSKMIADLKARKNTLRIEISGAKLQIGILNKGLASKLTNWSTIKQHSSNARRTSINEVATKRAEVAQEKLKANKKLTTEDILAMQRQGLNR